MLSIQLKNIDLKNFSLKEICFSLKKGQALSIIGPNGAGKTTLLKSIAGIYSGDIEVLYHQKPISQSMIEYIPPFIQPQLSIQTKYFLMASMNKLKISSEDESRMNKIFSFLKINHLVEKDLKTLSSGEAVKVLLAKALLSKKPIILWDEPTSFLDLKYRFFLQKFVLYLKKSKIFILSTHDLKWAKNLTDYYLGLKNGRQDFLSQTIDKNNLKKLIFE